MQKEKANAVKKQDELKTQQERGKFTKPVKGKSPDTKQPDHHHEDAQTTSEETETIEKTATSENLDTETSKREQTTPKQKEQETKTPAQKETAPESNETENAEKVETYKNVLSTNSVRSKLQETQLKEAALPGFSSVKSVGSIGRRFGAGVLTLVRSEKNGKRAAFAEEVMDELGTPETVQIALSANEIAIGEKLPDGNTFNIRKSGSKGVVYSAPLIDELTEHFNLDYTGGRVSITFYKVRYVSFDGSPVAIITINEDEVTE